MKKIRRTAAFFGIMIILSLSMAAGVHAEVTVEHEVLTGEERYHPRYFLPVSEEAVDATGADTETLEEFLIRSLKEQEKEINIRAYHITPEDFKTFYYQMLNNHAELFFVKSEYSCIYNAGNDVVTVTPKYLMTKQEAEAGLKKMDEAAEQALDFVEEDMEDYEKALVVHDWLAVYCEYDYERLEAGQLPDISHSAYGALVNRIAVCDGYSQAYQYIMQNKLGITCMQTSSTSMAHAWNLIRIGTSYYHVDVTWDDPVWDCIGRVTHSYFLLSDAGITAKDHNGWVSVVQAEDAGYESAQWKDSRGQILYENNTWYYVNQAQGALVKTDDLLNGTATSLFSAFNNSWKGSSTSYYPGVYSYPQLFQGKIMFNTAKQIYSISAETEELKVEYMPSVSEIPADTDSTIYNIYGFKIEGDEMLFSVQTSPSLNASQKGMIHTAKLTLPELAGSVVLTGDFVYGSTLTAEVQTDLTAVTGWQYEWYRGETKIADADGKTYQLTAEDVGKRITVKVTKKNFAGELSADSSVIKKAVPTVPESKIKVKCQLGDALGSIQLPSGYTWQNEEEVMDSLGEQICLASYCPDLDIYEELADVEVLVLVECQEHRSTEIRNMTEADCRQEGYTGDTYCTDCGELLQTGVIVPKTAHQNVEVRNVTDATFDSEGYTGDTYCLDCGELLQKGSIIPAYGQQGGQGNDQQDGQQNNQQDGQENDQQGGQQNNQQTGQSSQTEGQPALSKGDLISIGTAKYRITGAKTVELVKVSAKTKSFIVKDSISYKGKTYQVTSIGAKACKNNKKLTKVTVGSNVKTIGKEAFYGCKNLNNITIRSKKLKSVGKNAVKNIKKTAVIKCPSSKLKAYKKLFAAKSGYKKTMKLKK